MDLDEHLATLERRNFDFVDDQRLVLLDQNGGGCFQITLTTDYTAEAWRHGPKANFTAALSHRRQHAHTQGLHSFPQSLIVGDNFLRTQCLCRRKVDSIEGAQLQNRRTLSEA